MFFGALQNKERERNSLVSNSFSFYYSILCFPFIISRLHPLLLLLCGDLRFSYCQGHRYWPSGEEWDTAQHTAHARAGGFYRQADGVCQERWCHNLGTSTSEWERGKGKNAHCNRLRAQKVQETCIFQIINRAGKSVGQKGYELETSKFLFLSSFCSASKNSLFNICKDIKSTQDGMLDFEFIDSNFTA